MLPEDFFFLRPLWLFALLPAALLVWLTLRGGARRADSGWRGLVDPHLLQALAVPPIDGDRRSGRLRALALALGLGAAVLAMAGPTWQKIELPTFQTKEPVVVVLSLAQSMNASDVSPSRLTRAGHKLRDILAETEGGDTGLVLYSDVPFVAAPLTSDGAVIAEMLPELSTDLMPTLGNRLDLAIAEATRLLQRAGASSGRIVVLSDNPGSNPDAAVAAARAAARAGYSVHVIGTGANGEAPLRTASGRVLSGADGRPLKAVFDPEGLAAVARAGGGTFVPLTPGPDDVKRVLDGIDSQDPLDNALRDDLRADTWADMGYWLLLIPVVLAPFAFRRNLMMALALLAVGAVSGIPAPAQALEWASLWQTPDQQGAAAFEKGDFGTAAQRFENPAWQGAARFRAGDHAGAARAFSAVEGRDAGYDLGTALARSGALEEALAVFDRHLEAYPDDADARYNRDLVASLLEKMREQEEQEQEQEQQDQQQQDQQQQAGGQQDQQQQDGGQEQQQQQQSGGQEQQQQSGGQEQQQQQAGGQEQQQQQAGGQEQQQQQAGGQEQQQQQAGGQEQQQQKAGGQEQQQQQAGGQDQQQQQAGGQEQQQAGGQEQQQAASDGAGEEELREPLDEAAAQAGEPTDATGEPSAFARAMDALLGGNQGERTEEELPEAPRAELARDVMTDKEQAIEQMLRRVPDDASGLLRARIRQHYLERRGQ